MEAAGRIIIMQSGAVNAGRWNQRDIHIQKHHRDVRISNKVNLFIVKT